MQCQCEVSLVLSRANTQTLLCLPCEKGSGHKGCKRSKSCGSNQITVTWSHDSLACTYKCIPLGHGVCNHWTGPLDSPTFTNTHTLLSRAKTATVMQQPKFKRLSQLPFLATLYLLYARHINVIHYGFVWTISLPFKCTGSVLVRS